MAHLRYGGFDQKTEKHPALTTVLSLAMTAVTHPMTSVKVLVQVGHEPIPPVAITTFFGNKVMRLPSLIQYGKHLVKTDGYLRLYSGLFPRLVNQVLSPFLGDAVLDLLQSTGERLIPLKETAVDDDTLPTDKDFKDDIKDFTVETCKQTAAKCVTIMVSHPLQVISVRMIVQYVGKEAAYSGMGSTIKEIMKTEGIPGFFVGLVPRLVGEILSLWICRSVHYLITRYGFDREVAAKKEINVYTTAISQWIAAYLTYPFTLVSNIMIVNNKGLAGGNPPNMPIYGDWVDCFKHLRSGDNLWRGSSLLRRTVKEPKKSH